MSRDLAKRAGISHDPQEVHPRVFTASNHELPIIGKARIPFELGPHLVMHEVFVVDSPSYHAILGTDILRKCGSLTIDFSEKLVDFTNPLSDDITRVPMAIQASDNNTILAVCLLRKAVIPPNTETYVNGFSETRNRTPGSALFVPDGQMQNPAFAWAVVQKGHPLVPLAVVNFTNDPVTLYAGQKVGSLVPIEEKQIGYVIDNKDQLLSRNSMVSDLTERPTRQSKHIATRNMDPFIPVNAHASTPEFQTRTVE